MQLSCFWIGRLRLEICLGAALICLAFVTSEKLGAACLTNPMMQGQDPSVVLKDGIYHLVQSDGCAIHLRRSATLGGLATATGNIIWNPGCGEVWAPELHFLNNRWYLYYSRNPGNGHRVYVAESQTTNVAGAYTYRGPLFNTFWNIDGNVIQTSGGQLYFLFSGNQGTTQNLYIAPMSNPYTLSGTPVLLSEPTLPWERIGDPKVNEGPWAFEKDGRIHVVYSASGCWTDDYTLGLLTFTGANMLDRTHWTKSGPVFTKQPGSYGPGHNGIVRDAAGQWWNVYHANNNAGEGCGGLRRIRAQRIHWTPAGAPDFGTPVPIGSLVNEDPDFLCAHFKLEETTGTTAFSAICGRAGTMRGNGQWLKPGLALDGATSYVDAGAGLGNDVQHALTLAAWIRADEFRDWAGIITKGTNASPYALQTWRDGSLRFTANFAAPAGSAGGGSWDSTMKMAPGVWYHTAVTYDGIRLRFYINGVLDGYQPVVPVRFGVVNEPLYLGADFPGGDEYFKGSIADARVYGRGLSEPEIIALANRPPALSAVADVRIGAGQMLSITNKATDPDPGQTLTFRLLSGPNGAALDSSTGLFTWRPAVAQADTTNRFALAVTDSGVGRLSATQSFTAIVTNLTRPRVDTLEFNSGAVHLRVSGDSGPDYIVQVNTNVVDASLWTTLFRTNSPPLPFVWQEPINPGAGMKFYRVQCE